MAGIKRYLAGLVLRWLGEQPGAGAGLPAADPSLGAGGAMHRGADHLRAAVQHSRRSRRSLQLTPVVQLPFCAEPLKPAGVPGWLQDKGVKSLAMDAAQVMPGFADILDAYFSEGIGFFGYTLLAQLSQRAEYRKMVETIAMDMTREWIRFTYSGDEDKSETIRVIEAKFKELCVQDRFRQALELDGFYGRSHIYVDIGDSEKPDELKTRLVLSKRKIGKGALRRLTVVDPTWTYPGSYNSTNPLSPWYYTPETWWIMTTQVDDSRLITFVGRPVPDLLKPAYQFGGLALTQMAKPYVDNWLKMRQSVSDLVESFTQWVIKTDMSTGLLGGDADGLNARADLFNTMRQNAGIMMIAKGGAAGDTGEEFANVSAPLTGLNDLLGASQEQMCSVAGIPLVKFLGTTPSGLNASSDGEVRVYYDTIAAQQERMMRSGLETVLKMVQLSELGSVDEDIGIEFLPLWQMDETQQATARKADADTDAALVNAGIVAPEEVREKLAADKAGPWANLDTSKVPEDPELEMAKQAQEFGQQHQDREHELSKQQLEAQPKAGDAEDERIRDAYKLHGFDIVVENPRGSTRVGVGPQGRWSAVMAADYGYIDATWSAEGRGEQLDCFVGPRRASRKVFVIDQLDPSTGIFDEHKVVFGVDDAAQALGLYTASFDDPARAERQVMGITELSLPALRQWVATGDLYRPLGAGSDVKSAA